MGKKNKKDSIGKLILFEPNPDDNVLIPNEDLSILVDLTTTRKGRSVIYSNEKIVSNQSTSSESIGFIDGTKIGYDSVKKIDKRALTTNYTEANSNLSVEGENDLESLGIESINIEFDTAYTPKVQIKFIDIRGQAVFQQGVNSKYKAFFELPYPIFNLTVKGFFGQAVKYCLHLTKWNSKFNSSTGNFEIQADFIGYTYALLTDLLMGYIRAVVYTPEGAPIFDKYKQEWAAGGKVLKTIDEMLGDIQRLGDEFKKIKQNDSNLKEINQTGPVFDAIEVIERRLAEITHVIISEPDIYFNGNTILATSTENADSALVKTQISHYKAQIKRDLDGEGGLNKDIGNDNLKLKTLYLENIIEIRGIKGKQLKTQTGAIDAMWANTTKVIGGQYNAVDEQVSTSPAYELVNDLMVKVLGNLPANFAKENPEVEVVIYDFRQPFIELERTKKALMDSNNVLREKVGNKLREVAEIKLDFDPTIYNIFSILTVHCEVFLETLSEVSKKAEKNDIRKKILNKVSDDLNIRKDSEIFSWPEYKEKNNGHYEETWLGSVLDPSEYTDVNEVVFVENLLAEMMKLVKRDDTLILNQEEDKGANYWPVGPLDVPEFSDGLIKHNPYKVALESNESKGTPEEATRLLIMRGFLGINLSNRLIQPVNVEMMGRLEAENLFDVLRKQDKVIARNMIGKIRLIGQNEDGEPQALEGALKLIEQWKVGFETEVVNPTDKLDDYLKKGATPLIEEISDGYYTYVYINDLDGLDEFKTFLPISGGFDGTDFYNKDGLIANEFDNPSDKILYTSTHTSGLNNAQYYLDGTAVYPEDGSVYFKILSESAYNNSSSSPDFGHSLFTDIYNVPVDTVVNQDTLIGATYNNDSFIINPYIGSHNVNEIKVLNYNGIGEGASDGINETHHYLKHDEANSSVSSVLCAFWHQDNDYSEQYMGGNYLSRGYDSRRSPSSTINNRGEVSNLTNSGFMFDEADRFTKIEYNRTSSRNPPYSWGKQRELIGELYGDTEFPNPNDIHIPYIEFSVCNETDEPRYHFSLLGSKFYYRQHMDGRAFLFLNSFSWQGLIGNQLDIKTGGIFNDKTSSSLFHTFIGNTDGGSFEESDDTPTLKGLFNSNGSFIHAPYLWCAMIGAQLYRHDRYTYETNVDILSWHDAYERRHLLPWQTATSYVPRPDEILHDVRGGSSSGINFMFDGNDKTGGALYEGRDDKTSTSYPAVDRIIRSLPQQVRNEFKRIFWEFVEDYEKNLAPLIEIFTTESNNRMNRAEEDTWNYVHNQMAFKTSHNLGRSSITTDKAEPLLDQLAGNSNWKDNYSMIAPQIDVTKWVDTYQFNTVLKEGGPAENLIKSYIKKNVVLLNGKPRLFKQKWENKADNRSNLRLRNDLMHKYLQNFFIRFEQLADDWSLNVDTVNDEIQNRLFNSIDDDAIKLNIYRSLGSIHNKWVAGTDNPLKGCGTAGSFIDNPMNKESANYNRNSSNVHFIDSFRFLDRAFNNIGDKFYLNPLALSSMIVGNYNQSFFDITNKTLSDNNFNFIALPTFLNFNDEKQLEKMFQPFSYKEVAGGSLAAGPSFVCVYVGQTSTNLDLGTESDYDDDGITVQQDSDGKILANSVPEDFQEDRKDDGSLNIPMFLVSYGKQNQSYFKDVHLDQREFVETAESLQIIEDISQQGDNRKPNHNGQNLFNVYQTRSYSAEVEMMGNAMVQPMMYFQLNNIPMFRGAYMIIKTSHNITSHDMTTKFTGVRVKATRTPLVKASTIFMNLISSLEGVGTNPNNVNNGGGDGGGYTGSYDFNTDSEGIIIS